ncbi:MAG: stalk domain-containing protein [Peptoniphilaceae bacterium]
MKKKFLSLSLVLMMILTLVPQTISANANDVKLWINGDYVTTDVAPKIENNRTLVPLRVISENLGYKVHWEQETKSIIIYVEENGTISENHKQLGLQIGDKRVSLLNPSDAVERNTLYVYMDIAPKIVNNRTMVPIRFIAEEFGQKVDWDNDNRTAIVGDGYVKPVAPVKTGLDANKLIQVAGGDLSGYREPNVKVNVGFGNREYWAYTNEYGQLVKVTADKIVLQDEVNEPINSKGRYYNDEAKVPGTESPNLDEGHVIADSLGGVSNAYNITPQNSTLNRHGDQAYMEKVIRDALRAGGSCTDFVATITYPNTNTQIPSHYNFKYILNGNAIEDSFDNVNPDVVNSKNNITPTPPPVAQKPINKTSEVVVVNQSINQKFTADTTQGVIKGNKRSKIYHVPGGASYNRISVKNVVYFNTEQDAINAGYRAAKR